MKFNFYRHFNMRSQTHFERSTISHNFDSKFLSANFIAAVKARQMRMITSNRWMCRREICRVTWKYANLFLIRLRLVRVQKKNRQTKWNRKFKFRRKQIQNVIEYFANFARRETKLFSIVDDSRFSNTFQRAIARNGADFALKFDAKVTGKSYRFAITQECSE